MWSSLDLVIDPTDPLRLYAAGFTYGFNLSTDGGATWSQSNTGLTDLSLLDVAIDPQDPFRLYAVDGNVGVFTSADRGVSWGATGAVPGHPSVAAVNPA